MQTNYNLHGQGVMHKSADGEAIQLYWFLVEISKSQTRANICIQVTKIIKHRYIKRNFDTPDSSSDRTNSNKSLMGLI